MSDEVDPALDKLPGKSELPDTYRRFFELSADLCGVCDLQGKLLDVNRAWTVALGFSKEELVGKNLREFIHPEDREVSAQAMSDVRVLAKNSEPSWFRAKAVVDEKLGLIYSTIIDIGEELTARQKLNETKVKLRACLEQEVKSNAEAEIRGNLLGDIFSKAPCLAALSEGPQHIFKYANESYSHLVGHRQLIGRAVRDVIVDLEPGILNLLDEVYASGKSFVGKDVRMSADWTATGHVSEKFFTLIYAPVLGPDGKSMGLWSMAFDTTEQKRLETFVQITERVSAIGRMAAGVAHEINNPLTYVLGSFSLLHKNINALCAENALFTKAELSRLIHRSEGGVLRICDIVRSLNRLSDDGKEMKRDFVLIQEAVDLALEYSKNESLHKAKVRTEIEPGLSVFVNKGSLNQVLLNLIINACHAIPLGHVNENEITISGRTDENYDVVITVSDTGDGIPKENLDRIFEPFFTSKPVGEGTGLGLSICYSIVKSMGGQISVKSEVKRGSVFTILIPGAVPLRADG